MRLPPRSEPNAVMPVTFPPGSDKARAHRVSENREHDRNRRCCVACRQRGLFQYCVDYVDLEIDQILGQGREIAVCAAAVLDDDVFSFDISKVAEAAQECLREWRLTWQGIENSNPSHLGRRLRERAQRYCAAPRAE